MKSPAYSEFEKKHFRNSQVNYSHSSHSKNPYDIYSSFRHFKDFQHLTTQPQQLNSIGRSESECRPFFWNPNISPNKQFQMEMDRYAGKCSINAKSRDMFERGNTEMEYSSSLEMPNHPFSRNLEAADLHQNDSADSDFSFVEQRQTNALGFIPRSTPSNLVSPRLSKPHRTESIFMKDPKNQRYSYSDDDKRDFVAVRRSPPSLESNPFSRHIIWNTAQPAQSVFPEESNIAKFENNVNELSTHSTFQSTLVSNKVSLNETANYTEDSYMNRTQSSDPQSFSECLKQTEKQSHVQQPVTFSPATQFQEINQSSVIRYEKSTAGVSQLSEFKSENAEPDSELQASHVMTPSVQTSVIKWNHAAGPKVNGDTCDKNIKEEKEIQKTFDCNSQIDKELQTANVKSDSNGDFKILIPKRKTSDPFGCNSDSDEDQSQKIKPSVVPLKKRQRMLEIPYATGHAVNQKVLPVMSFTFEEEFQIADYIVRIQHYQNQRFEFVCKNFPKYKELTVAFIAFTNMGRKIPFNLQIEKMLVNIGLEFTKQT